MIIRLIHWAFRIKCLPGLDANGQIVHDKRPPSLGEAITGISGT